MIAPHYYIKMNLIQSQWSVMICDVDTHTSVYWEGETRSAVNNHINEVYCDLLTINASTKFIYSRENVASSTPRRQFVNYKFIKNLSKS